MGTPSWYSPVAQVRRNKSQSLDLFRKSRAMHLYQAGMPLAMLSEFLGHEDPQTTLIYARADAEMKRDALAGFAVAIRIRGLFRFF